MGMLHVLSGPRITKTGIGCELSEGFGLHVDLLEHWLLRIAIVPTDGLCVDRTWMIAPDGEVPWEGRDRLSVDGFSCPAFKADEERVWGDRLAVKVEHDPLRLTVLERRGERWDVLLEDRPGGAYQWFERRGCFKHFQTLGETVAHYGLADKTGPLDRTGRRLRCLQSDALGYDAECSDPLYKHGPFMIVSNRHASAGLFYDSLAEMTFDLGAEHSNYFPRFRHVDMQEKGMVFYVLAGPKVADVVPRLHKLTGPVAFPPRWSLGFAFTTMHHADAPDAQQVISDFALEARKRDLPISAIHLGSGYTAGADGLRYVFNWNDDRFPDRDGFFFDLKAMGYRTCANIKPVLLAGHKAFDRARDEGWFVQRADGGAAVEMFWGGRGASLDFTNQQTVDWWARSVGEDVLGAGFDAVWNDNNEAELWDETARLNGFGSAMPALEARPLQALLMTRASYEATLKRRPDARPYTISRAGPIGLARYAETWSGDNRTSWHTLKWNLRQGLSMALSGMPLVGHDVGGFAGPPPGPELLVRWFQMMALHPRCVMNSWKEEYENIPNLPWMHEAVFDDVKAALELRYRFLPLLYSLVYHAHQTGHPVVAPPLYHFDDPACREDADTFMLGADVLVAPVVHEGARRVSLYLPRHGPGWLGHHCGTHFAGGQRIEVDAPLSQLPLFVRAGSVLPLAVRWDANNPHDANAVALSVYLGAKAGAGSAESSIFFDDGDSWDYRTGEASKLNCRLDWTEEGAQLLVREMLTGQGRPAIDVDGRGFRVHTRFDNWDGAD